MNSYSGRVVFDAAEESVYLDLTIDDLDSPAWVGQGDLGEPLVGLSALDVYKIKLVGSGHERHGQTAGALVDCDDDGLLRFGGQTPFA